MPRLEFSHVQSYAFRSAISLSVVLRSGGEAAHLVANVDTGASNCVFERENGNLLNIEIEAGEPQIFATAAGRVETFGHVVSIGVLGIEFESMVYFFADEHIKKNLLGRIGWLDRVRLGLVDHDQTLYLAAYDFEPSDVAARPLRSPPPRSLR
jgi:hypothetical protein